MLWPIGQMGWMKCGVFGVLSEMEEKKIKCLPKIFFLKTAQCARLWKRPVYERIRVKDTFIKYRMASVQQWHTLSWGALLCHSQTRLLYTLNRGGSKPRWNHPEARPQWFTGMFPLALSSLNFIRFDMFPLSISSLYLIRFDMIWTVWSRKSNILKISLKNIHVLE